MSALAELERLQGVVGAQKERVEELNKAREDGARRVERARARLVEFYADRERLGQGAVDEYGNITTREAIIVEMPDMAVGIDAAAGREVVAEADLIEELREAQGGVLWQADVIPYGEGQNDVQLSAVDPRAEAMYKGAVEALEEREQELVAFTRENLPALAAERAPIARAVCERSEAALEEARRAAAAHETERSWWARTLSAAGMESLLRSMGENALRFAADAGEAEMPMPGDFLT